MTTADTKKRITDTSPKTKHGTESNEPSKPTTPNTVNVVRRSAVQSSAETTRTSKPDTVTEPKPNAPPTAKMPTYEKRMRELPPVVRLRRKLEATVKRFTTIAGEVHRWRNAPDLRETASRIESSLAAMLADATTMPDAFQPERVRKTSARQLAVGMNVSLCDKVVAKYEGILEPEERASFEVLSTSRSHVSVKTASGARLVLPRSHIAKLTMKQAAESVPGSVAPGE